MRDNRKQPDLQCIKPGHGYLPRDRTKLWSIVGSGVLITLFDTSKRIGGMVHYKYPIRPDERDSTSIYAAPAIQGLLNLFEKEQCDFIHLEAQVIGGAIPPDDLLITSTRGDNVKVALEILSNKQISIASQSTGGHRGRKVVFDTGSGETVIAQVESIRCDDWTFDNI